MTMLRLYITFLVLGKSNSGLLPSVPTPTSTSVINTSTSEFLGDTRRIIRGHEIYDTRPYMVYLRPTQSHSDMVDRFWLCGGVIVHESYILTSAACIEDIKFFWVVSGTHKWYPESKSSKCIENGALRAVWKCVHKTYRFDGNVFNNIRWMVNDIAVVMTEAPFSFTRRVKGCDFIPNKIQYNNISKDFENPGTSGFIAGWGSKDRFTDATDVIAQKSVNSHILMEVETLIITKENCKNRWLNRYHAIIDDYMFCGKQAASSKMTPTCVEDHIACRQLLYSEEDGPRIRRFDGDLYELIRNSAAEMRKRKKARRKTRRTEDDTRTHFGGFCENDHGGPFVTGRGQSSMVIGIMSSYKVENNSKRCHGPFLYTSVFNNRHLIHCAIYKEDADDCTSVLRDDSSVLEEETFDWGNASFRSKTIYEGDEEEEKRSHEDPSEEGTPQETLPHDST
ncbi:uncharacterized protein LOC125225621 isoform X2 [Leguminivora glycinivorella]|uniref:uncharacterized protein LOC125225621 isoform X2 n=1 Tax=Leguminivora glycinivorella TaxID=1035111 RepID=UPI00200D4445|nr:uncharacterized protein LOC125225621 isoform X2 [Leguminivora glycinivorella]